MSDTVIVTGPPCAGKTTYVTDRAAPGDTIIDFDLIAQELGSPVTHGHAFKHKVGAWDAFERLVDTKFEGTTWVVKCAPTQAERDALVARTGGKLIVLDTPPEVCKERAKATGRPDEWPDLIDEWWETHRSTTPDVPSPRGGVVTTPNIHDTGSATETTDPTGQAPGETTDENENDDDTEVRDPAAVLKALKKANTEAASLRKRLQAIEDAGKTEAQRRDEENARLKTENSEATLRALRLEVGMELGLPKTLALRLQGTTEEELRADAADLQKTIGSTNGGKPPPVQMDGGAGKPAPTGGDMNAEIRKKLGR